MAEGVDFIKDFVLPVGVGVAIPAVIAAWVVFDKRGQLFWTNLGTFEWAQPDPFGPVTALGGSGKHTFRIHGVRTVAIAAVIAFIIALGALTAFLLRPSPAPGLATVPHLIVQRFGEKGPAGRVTGGGDEGDYVAIDDKTQSDAFVAHRKDYPICAISTVNTSRGPGGDCEMIQSPGDDWRISVSGKMGCRVTCFEVQP